MFKKWMRENDLRDYSFSSRLFPPASDRAFWEKVTGEEQIRLGEKYLGYEWPLIRTTQFMEFWKSGDRLAQENPHFDRRSALLCLFLAELAENKGRFLPDLCDGIFVICEETSWGLSAHYDIVRKRSKCLLPMAWDPYIDLFNAETAALLSIVYHVLHKEIGAFCPEILERIEHETERRIVTPYLSHSGYHWMGYRGKKVNNWCPWILSNILAVFLTMDMPRSTFFRGMDKMLREMQFYYDCIPEDGGCDEGSNYWTKAGGKLFEFCERLFIATDGKVNFFGDEKLHRIALYQLYAHIDGCRFVNFSDGNSLIANGDLDSSLYGFGKRLGDPSLCALAGTVKRAQKEHSGIRTVRGYSVGAALYSLIYRDEIDSQPDPVHEDVYLLPDTQNAFVRGGDWYFAAKGGNNNESHNHNDVGSFIVYHKGAPVLVDAGCGTYTRFTFTKEHRYTIWTMQSGWHNLPVLNGCEQPFGEDFRADAFSLNDKTCHVRFQHAYPAEAGVLSVKRTISLSETGVTLLDHFDFQGENNTLEEHFITPSKPQVKNGKILLGGEYFLDCHGDFEFFVEEKTFADDPKLVNAWGTDRLYRIRLLKKCGKEETANITIGGWEQ